jgi:hypothetical protein
MEHCQGRRFSEKEAYTIRTLLATTDLTIGAIAERMGCSIGAVASINRKAGIRDYSKKRSSWIVDGELVRAG